MPNFKRYQTINLSVRRYVEAIRLHTFNIEGVAKLCGAFLVEDPFYTPEDPYYSGMDAWDRMDERRIVPLGWFVVRYPQRAGGGFIFIPPKAFVTMYEPAKRREVRWQKV